MTGSKRILLYTGKGGVGKTSVAAATALRCAERGYRTVVLSTDTAHSLADSFDTPLGPEPVQVAPNLWGQEVDIYYSIEKHWAKLQKYLASVFSWQGVNNLLAEEVAAIPGMDEGSSLLWIMQHYYESDFDVIVVDCAPTSDTLRLLSLPETGRWWFSHLMPSSWRGALALAPIARPLLNDLPLPDKSTLDAADRLFKDLGGLHELLANPDVASMRLVVNPEKMVIKEAQRTYTYLSLYGYVTDGVVVNRVFPQNGDPYFAGWRQTQGRYLQLIEEAFSPLPILKAPYFADEVVGLDALRRMADALFGDGEPARLLFRGQTHEIDKTDTGYMLRLPLPLASRDDISLLRAGDELTVQVGNWRRNLVLPRALRTMQVRKAKLENQKLNIDFVAQEGKNNHD